MFRYIRINTGIIILIFKILQYVVVDLKDKRYQRVVSTYLTMDTHFYFKSSLASQLERVHSNKIKHTGHSFQKINSLRERLFFSKYGGVVKR